MEQTKEMWPVQNEDLFDSAQYLDDLIEEQEHVVYPNCNSINKSLNYLSTNKITNISTTVANGV
jgi:hypothetical protein